MTKLAKVGTAFVKLVIGSWSQPCVALCEADLLVLWGFLVAMERLVLASRDHWNQPAADRAKKKNTKDIRGIPTDQMK